MVNLEAGDVLSHTKPSSVTDEKENSTTKMLLYLQIYRILFNSTQLFKTVLINELYYLQAPVVVVMDFISIGILVIVKN